MKNLTLAIDDAVLEKARAYAKERGTTLNALVRSFLVREIDQAERMERARAGLVDLMKRSEGADDPNYGWDRRDAYDERESGLLPGHERTDLRGDGEAA